MAVEDSIPLLAALLQREVMLVLSASLGRPLQGLGSGAKALQLSTATRRRIPEIDSLLGWVKKLSKPGGDQGEGGSLQRDGGAQQLAIGCFQQ